MSDYIMNALVVISAIELGPLSLSGIVRGESVKILCVFLYVRLYREFL